jgi:hypothetical protein
MKSKQLANVLIKTLGLYICLLAIPEVFSGIAAALLRAAGATKVDEGMWIFSSAIGATVQAIVGIFIITRSRRIAEFWFKTEDE